MRVTDDVAFSVGRHCCLGSPPARLEVAEMLATILTRCPDLTIDAAAVERFPVVGSVHGYIRVPATFTPR
jgi:cytochrome P450